MTQPPEFTEADYDIDLPSVLEAMGINPATVKADTVQLRFLSGKPIIEYTVIRAVPARVLALALLRGSSMELVPESPPAPPDAETPSQESKYSEGDLVTHDAHLRGIDLTEPCPVCGKQPDSSVTEPDPEPEEWPPPGPRNRAEER